MIYKNIKSSILIISLFVFSACETDKSTTKVIATQKDEISKENVDNKTNEDNSSSSKKEDKKAETDSKSNDEAVLSAALKIDNLVVKVHDNTFKTTSNFYTSTNKMLNDFTRMSESVTDRMNTEMNLLTTLAKPFKIDSNYSSIFSVIDDYTATKPAFVISKTLTNNYFLVSSDSKFYLQNKTIKTLFKDTNTLATAWSRAIINADKTKDLYLCLLELDSNGKVTQVTNSFLIKNATLKTY